MPVQAYEPHLQSPLTHVGPVPSVQALPQAPQLSGLVFVSTQVPPQHTLPPVHGGSHRLTSQIPPMHTWPGGHTFPHVPQLVESERVSTHRP
jgi:hypothetical protein